MVAACPKTRDLEVLLATWNGEAYLEEQLNSIARQTYPPSRLIVRDDMSTDGTKDILAHYKLQWGHWMQILPSSQRVGSVQSFEALMKASTARYIAFADQDDIWDATKLALCINRIKLLEQLCGKNCPMLIHADMRIINQECVLLAESFIAFQSLDPRRTDLDSLVTQNIVTGCTTLINRPLLAASLPFPSSVIQHDHWLALVASERGLIEFIDQPMMSYRIHGENSVGAEGSGLSYIIGRIVSLFSTKSPKARLRACLAQAKAFYQRYGCKKPQIIVFEESNPAKRLRIAAGPTLKKHGFFRNMALKLLLASCAFSGIATAPSQTGS